MKQATIYEERGSQLATVPHGQVGEAFNSPTPAPSNTNRRLGPIKPPPGGSTSPETSHGGPDPTATRHAGTLSSPSPQPSRETNASASALPAPSPEIFWNYSVPVPGSRQKKLIYPKAPEECDGWSREQCQERFVFVKNQLALLADKYLCLHGLERCPVYTSRMVGTSPSTAVPSIVVTCREEDAKSLQDLFRNRAKEKLRLSKESVFSQLCVSLGANKERGTPIPRLQLVYYRTSTASVIRKASDESLEVHLPDGQLYCGGIIRFHGASATLGLTFDIGDVTATLTVDHLFSNSAISPTEHPDDSEGDSHKTELEGSMSGSDDELHSGYLLCEDDDEYDDLDTFDSPPSSNQNGGNVRREKAYNESPATIEIENILDQDPVLWERIIPPGQLARSAPYLDWALTRPLNRPDPQSWHSTPRPNTALLNGRGTTPLCLDRIRRDPPNHLASVSVVSGIRQIIPGQILSQPSFLPSSSGREYSEAWTVILDKSDDILPGESGSVVVCRETNEVYGHVVGSDPLGHAYVVPLLKVDDLFDGLTYCDYSEIPLVCKPAREMYEKAMRHAGVEKVEDCYFVDDSFLNCVKAQEFGWTVAHLVEEGLSKPKKQASQYQIKSLQELRNIFPQFFKSTSDA